MDEEEQVKQLVCPICEEYILPGQRRICWSNQDDRHHETEHGYIHLSHLMNDEREDPRDHRQH